MRQSLPAIIAYWVGQVSTLTALDYEEPSNFLTKLFNLKNLLGLNWLSLPMDFTNVMKYVVNACEHIKGLKCS